LTGTSSAWSEPVHDCIRLDRTDDERLGVAVNGHSGDIEDAVRLGQVGVGANIALDHGRTQPASCFGDLSPMWGTDWFGPSCDEVQKGGRHPAILAAAHQDPPDDREDALERHLAGGFESAVTG
jgi:hypothetical protein